MPGDHKQTPRSPSILQPSYSQVLSVSSLDDLVRERVSATPPEPEEAPKTLNAFKTTLAVSFTALAPKLPSVFFEAVVHLQGNSSASSAAVRHNNLGAASPTVAWALVPFERPSLREPAQSKVLDILRVLQ